MYNHLRIEGACTVSLAQYAPHPVPNLEVPAVRGSAV